MNVKITNQNDNKKNDKHSPDISPHIIADHVEPEERGEESHVQ